MAFFDPLRIQRSKPRAISPATRPASPVTN